MDAGGEDGRENVIVVAFVGGSLLNNVAFQFQRRLSGSLKAAAMRSLGNTIIWDILAILAMLSGLAAFIVGFFVWTWWLPLAFWLLGGLGAVVVVGMTIRMQVETRFWAERLTHMCSIVASGIFIYLYFTWW